MRGQPLAQGLAAPAAHRCNRPETQAWRGGISASCCESSGNGLDEGTCLYVARRPCMPQHLAGAISIGCRPPSLAQQKWPSLMAQSPGCTLLGQRRTGTAENTACKLCKDCSWPSDEELRQASLGSFRNLSAAQPIQFSVPCVVVLFDCLLSVAHTVRVGVGSTSDTGVYFCSAAGAKVLCHLEPLSKAPQLANHSRSCQDSSGCMNRWRRYARYAPPLYQHSMGRQRVGLDRIVISKLG